MGVNCLVTTNTKKFRYNPLDFFLRAKDSVKKEITIDQLKHYLCCCEDKTLIILNKNISEHKKTIRHL